MNPSTDTAQRLASVLTSALGTNVTADELRGAQRLDDLVALDSIALLEFTVGLESEFGVRLDAERFTRDFVTDLPRLIGYLEARR